MKRFILGCTLIVCVICLLFSQNIDTNSVDNSIRNDHSFSSGPELAVKFSDFLYPSRLQSKFSVTVLNEKDQNQVIRLNPKTVPIILNNNIVAFYGKPGSSTMGILGLYSVEDLDTILQKYCKEYNALNGDKGVVGAFYLIFGTCWPKGEIGFLQDHVVQKYIKYAQEHNMLVFIDHQIGKYSVEESMNRILPYAKYPNVHLALDPEWRTLKPMEEIGFITAKELNTAQSMLSQYIAKNGITESKMLVVHQFHPKMIQTRQDVVANFDQVILIHCADGFGSPELKKLSYKKNVDASNMPLKGFKLFLKTDVYGAGYDVPLLTPKEVLGIKPEPSIIMYQ